MNTSIWLVAIPDEFSVQRRVDLKVLMNRAIRVEERLVKGVQVEDEQKRYQVLCDRIEYFGHLISVECPVPYVELGFDYLNCLIDLSASKPEVIRASRLLASFCPADRVGQQLSQFVDLARNTGFISRPDFQRKINFYRNAQNNHWGVVELLQLKTGEKNVFDLEETDELKQEFLSLKVADTVSTGVKPGIRTLLSSRI